MMRQLYPAAAVVIALATSGPAVGASDNAETYRQLNLFGDVYERVRADYVEPVEDAKLIEAAINGMLRALDPHSSYLDAKNFRDMQVQTRGEFGGLGIEVTMENGVVKVVSPIDDTPADRAGLKAGDFITHLDGEAVLGLSLSEAVEKMRGPVNAPIVLTVARPGVEQPFDVSLVRDVIRIQSVRSRAEEDIAYIRITSFNEQTESGLEKAATKLKEEIGDKMRGLVLDLRNNPGGLLDQAIAVSDAFLEKGEIVSTRGRADSDIQRYSAREGDLINGKPIIVLINGGSASASEIVAGALQDHRRAIVLGTKSFGKGSVQTIIPLQGHGALRLTTARYFTPSGTSIQATGIEPDIAVEQVTVTEPEGTRRQRRSEADLRGHLRGDNEPAEDDTTKQAPVPAPAEGEAEKPAEGAEKAKDFQLSYALDLLRGITLLGPRQN
jgi:carboxyl-terminal processing protease